ncbi:hypothetical protein M514_05448 [Trichuris suis]|uniref:Uncharacterized protein n=1 Tax=Trichuris suis TaxID=68888 RepID=A0A085M947_9BILA|nr:hypothetical protein M513_05448 [Trichuris suis]KFD72462.1 hypothetical protein M514_05448 [Trichuris suis]
MRMLSKKEKEEERKRKGENQDDGNEPVVKNCKMEKSSPPVTEEVPDVEQSKSKDSKN